jgi:hypothetical protein
MFKTSYIIKCNALKRKPLTQDELVDLCKALPKYKNKSYLQLLSNFRICIQKLYCDSYLESQNLNELWLLFYIYEKDGQTWYETKQKWL